MNAAIQIGDDGVLVVDTMTEPLADKMLAEIRRLAGDKPIRQIINTHVHPDHTAATRRSRRRGSRSSPATSPGRSARTPRTWRAVIAHENVLNRMSAPVGSQASRPFKAWPTDTFFTEDKDIYFNGEGIQLVHMPAAHTDGDVMVWFRKSDVVVAGDLFITTTLPGDRHRRRAATSRASSPALNRIIDITIPRDKQEGGTYVIPGHGRLTDEADVVDYRDMVDDHPRPVSGLDQERDDAGPGESREAGARLRRAIRRHERGLDHRRVRGRGLQEPGGASRQRRRRRPKRPRRPPPAGSEGGNEARR